VRTIAEFQAVDVDVVLAAQAGLPTRDPGGAGPQIVGTPFAPTLDGTVLSGPVIDEITAGRAAPVPLLIMHTRDEMQLFAAMGILPGPSDASALAGLMTGAFPDAGAAVDAYRNVQPGRSPAEWYASFLTDQNFHMPDFRVADARLGHDPRVWMARFSWESPAEGGAFGACHGLEIPFLFWRAGQTGGFLGDHEAPAELAYAMQDAWTSFARTGDPNCAGLPAWPRYETGDRAVMSFDTESRLLHDPDAALRALWQDVDLP